MYSIEILKALSWGNPFWSPERITSFCKINAVIIAIFISVVNCLGDTGGVLFFFADTVKTNWQYSISSMLVVLNTVCSTALFFYIAYFANKVIGDTLQLSTSSRRQEEQEALQSEYLQVLRKIKQYALLCLVFFALYSSRSINLISPFITKYNYSWHLA